ncbi:peptidyl-prolyl cis-trans isomerase [Stieleria sp. JC731]|uniref:peptidylprolyl isomerase n=1 Tax=Pirellulaceae TaxID=2691357 RepID=UPI001E577AF9|nr:peptidyl-prolyl cis-trans isomerase [Stieleria sp. JC731]MCC9601122.1 peptidyl-prolyl cis-trans isomerase [Stieleria sp. JC731]
MRYDAKHIQVASEQQAREIMQLWQDGADFGQLAQMYSTCPTACQGGELKGIGAGHLPPEIDAVIVQAEPGGIYGPIQTQHGFHLVELIGRTG